MFVLFRAHYEFAKMADEQRRLCFLCFEITNAPFGSFSYFLPGGFYWDDSSSHSNQLSPSSLSGPTIS
ncbi:hypothetical protein VN97_g9581 [Penicillium thymicola]|uniref:Uncharacterized protein n=1 Tax=Penicillium thymicola TaxID=293382 RepID=A0AAI9TAY2_PENTH|nr:hypothetical protein VN97_g9581 [Penicillium thymicola]